MLNRAWIFVLLLACCVACVAADSIGTVDFSTGQATLIRDGARQTIQEGVRLNEGDNIVTESDGEVHLDMVDGAALSIRPGSSVTLSKYGLAESDNILISLSFGALRSISGWVGKLRPKSYAVKTPTATIGIRGTDHETTYEPAGESAGTYERVFEGETVLDDNAGHQLSARPGAAVAFDHRRGQLRNLDERQLPRFIMQRARHDDRFEQRLKRNIDQRIRNRLNNHLTNLRKRDPAAAQQLQQRIRERFRNLSQPQALKAAPGGGPKRENIGKPGQAERDAGAAHPDAAPRPAERRFEKPGQRQAEAAAHRRGQAAAEKSKRRKGWRRGEPE